MHLQQAGTATGSGACGRIELFEYPAGPDLSSSSPWADWASAEDAGAWADKAAERDAGGTAFEAGLRAEFDKRIASETQRAYENGRERGNQEGRLAERAAQTAAESDAKQERTRQAADLIERFAQERERYLEAAEREVVKLALAVAARILRREAQMDPLLLTGAVRVALGQLSGSTEVRLRVPAAELGLWTEAIALIPNVALKPQIATGDGMRLGDCVIETEFGSVDLGIRAQLAEIERGFFDRAGGPRLESVKTTDLSAAPTMGNGA